MNRRSFLTSSIGATTSMLISFACTRPKPKPLNILLVSGWQDVNIGDIAHTPGLLAVLETFIPDANIILWKRSKNEVVEKLIKDNHPTVSVIYGNVASDQQVDSQEVLKAFQNLIY